MEQLAIMVPGPGSLARWAAECGLRVTLAGRDLDALLTQGYGHPVGPLELSDRIGLDLRLTISGQIFLRQEIRVLNRRKFWQMVDQGRLGVKTGVGFFEWDEGKRR